MRAKKAGGGAFPVMKLEKLQKKDAAEYERIRRSTASTCHVTKSLLRIHDASTRRRLSRH